ncbi:DUF6286 domain-containing protein [Actinomadura harenae]|uniref:DUF6286 domain-containing protein n=1 Tax=Actinomadura harenae TaxID=2483351 RepID=A0A3M2LRY8_9ACTN|nr:DUF6286 domain-containing protein [Actinomadura harenae]RMI40221.1 hypothetical protein EBO15_27380 [Actinomadura harenae]
MTTRAGRSSAPGRAGVPVGRGTRAARVARSAFRPRRIVTSLVAAVVLTASGTIVAIEVFSTMGGHAARLVPYGRTEHWAQHAAWRSWGVLAVCAAVALVGVWFLLAGLVPGRPRVVPLRGDNRDLAMAVTPAGLRNALAAAAEDVEGASQAHVVLGRHKVRVSVHCPSHEVDAVKAQVRVSVQEKLNEVRPLAGYRVAVRARTRRG